MSDPSPNPRFDLFLVTQPGLEDVLSREATGLGFAAPKAVSGGVETSGGWTDVWRANLELRTATRVLVRLGQFRAMHLAQLDKRARKFPWADMLPSKATLAIDVTCRKSRIYHAGAARDRVAGALRDALDVTIDKSAALRLMVRIDDDLCTFSFDTTGEPLHKRGGKPFVGKAPLRETMAAAFLMDLGFDGTQSVVDPMCGSGTIPLEAAAMAARRQPGSKRIFAFKHLPSFDQDQFDALKRPNGDETDLPKMFGFDRDQGAIRGAGQNAADAGLDGMVDFSCQPVSDLQRPDGAPGIVLVNPPYGARIGNRKLLFGLYGSLGNILIERFSGWTVGLVTSDAGLAKSTRLNLSPTLRVSHGGLSVTLHKGRIS